MELLLPVKYFHKQRYLADYFYLYASIKSGIDNINNLSSKRYKKNVKYFSKTLIERNILTTVDGNLTIANENNLGELSPVPIAILRHKCLKIAYILIWLEIKKLGEIDVKKFSEEYNYCKGYIYMIIRILKIKKLLVRHGDKYIVKEFAD